jgi:hypothetical protein
MQFISTQGKLDRLCFLYHFSIISIEHIAQLTKALYAWSVLSILTNCVVILINSTYNLYNYFKLQDLYILLIKWGYKLAMSTPCQGQ